MKQQARAALLEMMSPQTTKQQMPEQYITIIDGEREWSLPHCEAQKPEVKQQLMRLTKDLCSKYERHNSITGHYEVCGEVVLLSLAFQGVPEALASELIWMYGMLFSVDIV